MKIPVLGVDVDARLVAAARGIVLAGIIAAIAAAQKFIADPSVQDYAWVPIAAFILRLAEGFFDHADDTRPG